MGNNNSMRSFYFLVLRVESRVFTHVLKIGADKNITTTGKTKQQLKIHLIFISQSELQCSCYNLFAYTKITVTRNRTLTKCRTLNSLQSLRNSLCFLT